MNTIPDFSHLEINEQTIPVIKQMAEALPGGFFAYHADSSEELIYFNSMLPEMYGCESDEEFRALVGNSFRGMIHPADLKTVESIISRQIDASDRNLDHVRYRILKKDGSVHWLDDWGHYCETERFGGVYYVFVQNIDDQIAEQETITGLGQGYRYVACVTLYPDKTLDTSVLYRNEQGFAKYLPEGFEALPFTRKLDYLEKNYVLNDDREHFHKATRREELLAHLASEAAYLIDFRVFADGDVHYGQLKFTAIKDADDSVKKFVVAYANTDDVAHRQAEHLAVVDCLSQDYEYVEIVNITADKLEDTSARYRFGRSMADIIPAWEETLPFTQKLDLIIQHVVVEEDREDFCRQTRREEILRHLEQQLSYYVNFRARADDELHYIQIKFTAMRDFRGNITGFVAGFQNMDSAVKERMKQDAQQKEILTAALALAEQASRAKTTFLFNMSHDIRTPMNAILGFSRIARNHMDDRDLVLNSLNKIEVSGEQLLDLINDVLEMSRIESGKVEIQDAPVDMRELLESIDPLMEALAVAKSIDYRSSMHDISERFVWLDKVHASRVLFNLINNAIKYTNDGGKVRVDVKQTCPAVDGRTALSVSIVDTGIGMSEEFQKHMFEEFSREDTASVRGQQGTGLGLSIARRLTDSMGGDIEVISRQGMGSAFTVTFPVRVMNGDEVCEHFYDHEDVSCERVSAQAGNLLSGRKILLVEDNELNREIATELLEDNDMLVETAEDGRLALDKVLEKGIGYYDLILMDIQMPVMNGYEATKAIRALPDGDKVPIIAVSANAFHEDKLMSAAAGMNEHISKPVNVKELVRVMRSLIKK